jgi:hypothetical protein
MREELDKQLCEKYPYMFQERNMPMTQTCMCWGFSHGDGWFNIIDALCSSIDRHISWRRSQRAKALVFNRKLKQAIKSNDASILINPKYADQDWHIRDCNKKLIEQHFSEVPEYVSRVVVEQVKEKFGTLRFYYRGGDDTVYGMVRLAEEMSARTCEQCGVPATTENQNGWVVTLCKKHSKERKKKMKTGEW